MRIGERIKYNRELLKMTQDELGAACGTSKQTIFKYENGIITNIPLDKIEKISKALNVSPAYLMGWEEDTKWDSNIEPAQFDRNVVKIPVFPAVPAGTPIEALNDIIDWEKSLPSGWRAAKSILAL